MVDKQFTATGTPQPWVVPRGVKAITVTVDGAGSGASPGGRVSGRLVVVPGTTLLIGVGEAGKPHSGFTPGAATVGGGGAGGAGVSNAGGDSGGGASWIRKASVTGAVVCVAGGAGGTSGNGGVGGDGGGPIGKFGAPGVANQGVYGNATGGTQVQGGNGGTAALSVAYQGGNAPDEILGRAGAGGSTGTADTFGGGGGGGGYYPGGGGQAGQSGTSTAGGGGGGSNFTGLLTGFTTEQGGGSVSTGAVSISWTAPPPANQPPSVPTEVFIGGVAYTDDHVTFSTGALQMSAKVDDPKAGQKVRAVLYYTPDKSTESPVMVLGTLVAQNKRSIIVLAGLSQNTLYRGKLYTRDGSGAQSLNYTSITFWTNRVPDEPELVAPVENATTSQLDSVVFTWKYTDPDTPPEGEIPTIQAAFTWRYRVAETAFTPPGAWNSTEFVSPSETYVANPGLFNANTFYEWSVRTQDPQGAWGNFSYANSFYVTGLATAPLTGEPSRGVGVDVTKSAEFTWTFRDPDVGDTQHTADLRYRTVDQRDAGDWQLLIGSVTEPGTIPSWTLPPETFTAGVHYQWQVRTTDTLTGSVSDWSEPADFWTVRAPGEQVTDVVIPRVVEVRERLGSGVSRVFVYQRGGIMPLGEITPVSKVTWNRKRDDISNCVVTTNGFGEDCCLLLSELRCWMHEIVVFRDGVRVWEGPITRIGYQTDAVEIEAKDVMVYLYRRILRQGYDDSYRVINGITQGTATVVQRATAITVNALAPNDPNLLPYLSSIQYPDDAGQSRIVPDFSKTAWEEIDDLAATAGLDYTVVGRRIIYWDTHRSIGKLPEMRDTDFSEPPVVTEYGMHTATAFGVTNNAGVYGLATRDTEAYGMVEQLASAYGEAEVGSAAAETEVLTAAARAALEKTLTEQAERNIANRYPTPLVVRVPDNASLNPDINLSINHLVPGVWVPLRAQGTCRTVAQWQKLDMVTLTQDDKGEQVTVVMAPAPNGGNDPDAELGTEE